MKKIKSKFLATLVLVIAFLSNNRIFSTEAKPGSSSSIPTIADEQNLKDIEKTEEWKQLKKQWRELKKVKYSEKTWNEMDKQKQINAVSLNLLVGKGYLSSNVAFILNYVYADLLYHKLRSGAPMTCYIAYPIEASVMDNLENRLIFLSEISKGKSVKEDVLKQAKENIARDIEFLNRLNKLNEKKLDPKIYQKEGKALFNFFKDNKVSEDIKVEKAAAIAAELIVKLNRDKKLFFD